MTAAFGLALIVASALIALWIVLRFKGFGPKTVVWATFLTGLWALRLIHRSLTGFPR